MSLAADCPPDPAHLRRLRALADRVRPALISEHLAWSTWRGAQPGPAALSRTEAALVRISDNIARTQDALGRRIAIENPSHYLRMDGHRYPEIDFLAELSRRSGCGLLLDLNNVQVSAHNLDFDPAGYVDAFPPRPSSSCTWPGTATTGAVAGCWWIPTTRPSTRPCGPFTGA